MAEPVRERSGWLRRALGLALLMALVDTTGCCVSRLTDQVAPEPERPRSKTRVAPDAWPRERAEPMTPTPRDEPRVRATVRQVEMDRRGQRIFWTLNLDLENPSAAPRWFVVSGTVENPLVEATRVAGYTLFEADGVTMLQLYGTPTVEAVRLGAGARLQLRGLKLESYEHEPWTRLQVGSAAELQVSGRPVEARWLDGRDLTAPPGAAANAGTRRETASMLNEGYRDEPLTFVDLVTVEVPLDLSSVSLPPSVERNR